MTQDIVVVTVSYYSSAQLSPFIESVRAQSACLIIIANNAPDDDLSSWSSLPGVHVEEMPANLGYGGAINETIRRGTERPNWYLVVNPDVVFEEGAIDQLIARGGSSPQTGAVGPMIVLPTGETYPSARNLPSLRNGIGHALLAGIWHTNPWTRAYHADREAPAQERPAGWLSGACLLIRAQAFESVGGFDDEYFMYFEDVDLGARLASAGWVNVYVPSARVVHVGGHATERNDVSSAMSMAHHRSAYRYLASRYPSPWLLPLRLLLRVGLELRGRLRR